VKSERGKKKWAHSLRVKLYEILVRYHGPHSEWERRNNPGAKQNLRDMSYDETLRMIADCFSTYTNKTFEPSAVRQQIEWALSRQTDLRDFHRHTQIQNLTAAIEARFLRNRDLDFLNKKPLVDVVIHGEMFLEGRKFVMIPSEELEKIIA